MLLILKINGTKDSSEFEGITHAIYWFQMKYFKMVFSQIGSINMIMIMKKISLV